MPQVYSTGVSMERHLAMTEGLKAAEERAERRAELLAELPTPTHETLQGRDRERSLSSLSPVVIDANYLENMGHRLGNANIVTKSLFTKNIPEITNQENYEAYKESGNKHNTRIETDPSEIVQAWRAMKRQPEHILDHLHRNVWTEWQTASIYGAASNVLKMRVHEGLPINRIVRNIGAAAIEDFGFSLIESDRYKRFNRGYRVAQQMVDIGLMSVDQESILRAQSPLLFLVVQREQERRERFWGDLLERYEQPTEEGWGGYRRLQQDEKDEHDNLSLISQLQSA